MIFTHSFGGMAKALKERKMSYAVYANYLRRNEIRGRGKKLLWRRKGKHGLHVNWGLRQSALKTILREFTEDRDGYPALDAGLVMNSDIEIARSKVATFDALGKVSVPHPYVFPSADAATRAKVPFLARKDFLSAGQGIHVYNPGEDVEGAYDFFTELIPVRHEVRLHVIKDDVVVTQYKKPGVNPGVIRNQDPDMMFLVWPLEGYLGARNTAKAKEMAIMAVEAVGLDFGAVDLIYSQDRRLFVLEVNTAPGLMIPSVIDAYLKGFNLAES